MSPIETEKSRTRSTADLHIRRATIRDADAILRIERQSFGVDAWDRESFLEYLSKRKDCIFLVALRGDTVAGYAIAAHNRLRAEMDSVAVGRSHRGRGIAEALIKRLIRTLRLRGISKMVLTVRLNNAAAIRLYRRLGFRRERRLNGYYGDGAPAWRMKASL